MPALWGDISICLAYEGWKQTLSSARQWFDRAQDMRRSLFIRYDIAGNADVSPQLWKKLLEFMAQYRLEELDLVYPIHHVALKLPDNVWPSIERLHLKAVVDRRSSGQQLFSNFGKLSNLRHLKIYGSYYLDGMDRIVPWHQLRTFEVVTAWESPVTPSSCLNVLRQSRLLEHCRITLSKESSFTIPTEEKIVLANMDYFKAEFSDGSAVPIFLQPLVIPNVTTFSLGQLKFTQLDCDMPTLIGIIQRSGGMRRIRRLEICASSSFLDIGVLLELLPSLESISIKSGRLSHNSIKELSSGKLGPRLCNIYLDLLHDSDQILSMVESRYQNATQPPDGEQVEDTPCPFKSVYIPCSTTLPKVLDRNRIKLLSEKCSANICLNVLIH